MSRSEKLYIITVTYMVIWSKTAKRFCIKFCKDLRKNNCKGNYSELSLPRRVRAHPKNVKCEM